MARYFGVSEGFFLGLQSDYELMERRRQIQDELASIAPRGLTAERETSILNRT